MIFSKNFEERSLLPTLGDVARSLLPRSGTASLSLRNFAGCQRIVTTCYRFQNLLLQMSRGRDRISRVGKSQALDKALDEIENALIGVMPEKNNKT
jgi:hypothetical protein